MSQQKGMNFREFRQRFQTEEACEAYFDQRWPDGFICPKCGGSGCYRPGGRREYVCKMLRETDMSIAEIAQAVGYDSQSKFTTAFKAFFQVLPREYRKISCKFL